MRATVAGVHRSRAGSMVAAAVLVAALGFVPAPDATAVFNPVGGGETSLDLSKRIKKRLKRKEAKLRPISPVKKAPGGFDLPIENGSLNVVTTSGTLRHDGGLRFTHDGHRIRLRNPELKLGSDPRVDVKVGAQGRTLRFLRLQGGSSSAAGFGADIRNIDAFLTGKAAKRINRSLDDRVVRRGRKFGVLTTLPTLKRISVAGGQTTLTASTTLLTRLNTMPQPLFGPMSSTPIAPASIVDPPPPPITFSFPIQSGSVTPDLSSGEILHDGGLKLTRPHPLLLPNAVSAEDLSVNLADRVVDATNTIVVFTQADRVIRRPTATVDFSAATTTIDPSTRQITISGALINLTETAAGTFNSVFGPPFFPNTPGFMPNDPLGTATLTTTAN